MKTIVYVITKSIVGGAQTWVRDQTKLFQEDLNLIIITNHPGWLSEQNYANQTYFVKEIESKFSISAFLKILKIIKAEKADVVVSNSANAGLYARLCKIFYQHHSIYVSHGWSCIYNGGKFKTVFITIERLLSYLTDSILCVSKKDADNAIHMIGISNKKIRTIRNTVYPQKEKPFNENHQPFKLLFVGRLAHPKRLDLLIEAVQRVDDVTLTVIGDGPNRNLYHENEKIKFLGEIQNFNAFYQYDAFTLISDSEGLPMSALEAASAGLPLLLSDVGGCAELIKNNGFLVKNNIDDIVKAIQQIKLKYNDYQTSAHEIKNTFNITHYKKEYQALYLNHVSD